MLLAFVICHLTAHSLLLISIDTAEAGLENPDVSVADLDRHRAADPALLVHYGNALWSIYMRRSLRLSRWEWAQLALGLCIPVLLMIHVVSTRIAESVLASTATTARCSSCSG